MSEPKLKLCVPEPQQGWSDLQVGAIAPCMEKLSATERVQWALDYLPGQAILTSSFGAQSVVMLHLVGADKVITEILAGLPVSGVVLKQAV